MFLSPWRAATRIRFFLGRDKLDRPIFLSARGNSIDWFRLRAFGTSEWPTPVFREYRATRGFLRDILRFPLRPFNEVRSRCRRATRKPNRQKRLQVRGNQASLEKGLFHFHELPKVGFH
jgi:hypothetical protein